MSNDDYLFMLIGRRFAKAWRTLLVIIITHCSLLITHYCRAQGFTFVELNAENLFDTSHDSLKNDADWLPDGRQRWTPARYWRKVNHVAQELLACVGDGLPDLVALVEVENDSVLHALTRRSLLRSAGYEYLMTESPDVRGIDVALLYQPLSFRPLCYDALSVVPLSGMRPTRDILYVQGETLHHTHGGAGAAGAAGGAGAAGFLRRDTLHVFVVHAPSRFGGEARTRPFRRQVAERLAAAVDALPAGARIIVAGDFNDPADAPALQFLEQHGLHNITRHAPALRSAAGDSAVDVRGTYRYQGRWESIDHILVSAPLVGAVEQAAVLAAPFLLEADGRHGGRRPRRTYVGPRYQRGFSDHLPLIVRFRR